MPIRHIALFKYKPEAAIDTINEHIRIATDLKKNCIHPTTGQPYLLSSSGGGDNTDGAKAHGFKYAFVVDFANEQDKHYYSTADPAYLEFQKSARPLVESALIMDYVF